ncbi:oligosaccharide flippase family protein [Haladaptatus sp. DYSN1]|uniref:oligosaccharide flippase family protein n=1 Tax=unclassified Haladaptatus TaxID=2622732 RepID=UPI0024049D41|nr:oligosaccharide flippase family protein [Haladaptatus sp. DYSN1]
MTLAKKVGVDSLISGVRILIGFARGLVAIPLITNLLGTDSYGVWSIVLAFVAMVVTVGGLHLHGALIRYSNRGGRGEQAYIDILALTGLLGLVFGGIVYLAGSAISLDWIVGSAISDESTLVTVASLLILSEMLFLINISFSRSKGDIRTYESINVAKSLVETVGLIVVFLTGRGLVEGFLALLVVGLAFNALIMATIWTRYTIPTPSVANYRSYVAFGLPMVPKELFGSLLVHADKFLILYFMSPTAVGIYAVAYGISATFTKFTDALNPTLYPTVSKAWDEGAHQELSDLYTLIFKYYSIIAIPALVGISIVAEPLLALISTPEIATEGAILLPFLAVGFLLRGYDNPLAYILTATESTRKIGFAVVLASILNLGLNVALIPTFGLLGAVGASLFSQLVIVTLIYRFAARELPFTLPLDSIGKAILASMAMALVLVSIPGQYGPVVTLVAYPALGVVVYVAVMYLIDGISKTDVARVTGLLR